MPMDSEPNKPRCPGCGSPYDVKIPDSEFSLEQVDPGDSYCQTAEYVHIHRQSNHGKRQV